MCHTGVQNNPSNLACPLRQTGYRHRGSAEQDCNLKEVQLNCNKAFWKGILQLAAISLTTVSYISLAIKPDPNNLNKVKRRIWGFESFSTFNIPLHLLFVNWLWTKLQSSAMKHQLWNNLTENKRIYLHKPCLPVKEKLRQEHWIVGVCFQILFFTAFSIELSLGIICLNFLLLNASLFLMLV